MRPAPRRLLAVLTTALVAGALALGALGVAAPAEAARGADRPAGAGPTSTGPTNTGPTSAGPTSTRPTSTGPTSTRHLDLPLGFQPEGIAIDPDDDRFAYLGSRVDGDLVRLDLRTGRVRTLTEGPGTPSLGLKIDDLGRIFVAGGSGGDVRVVDAGTGRVRRSYDLVEGTSFLNDVVLTDDAVYVTDSANAQLFELPIGERGGLARRSDVRRVPLGGAWVQGTGTSANGITETPDGRALLVVNSGSGVLYRVNKKSGAADPVDLGGALLTNGDGLLLEGNRLLAVQNRLDRVAVVRLADDGRRGRVLRTLSDPDTDVPSTVARSGDRLLLPNARFTTPATPATPYWVTGIGVRQRTVTD